ncbi:MAG TPA: tRNA lysidine(34) synthetase TilS [Burkholderiales bacterium]|nr:tRNA lysidine(34) synthetase TilS [Burkholderiales bacterium]
MADSRKRRSASPRVAPAPGGALRAAARAVLEQVDLRERRLAVGLSGGVDSVVLLHALRELAPELGYRLSAVHVHHGLSPFAADWRRFCAALCRGWQVPFVSRRVAVARTGKGIEAAAREARYAAFSALSVEALALGHQLDDQAETVLLNLLRGAGVRGASAMRPLGALRAPLGAIPLLRPLLEVPRETIVEYARAWGLQWVDDESNDDLALTRNFLRLEIAPRLAARFPRWRQSLARAAHHFAEAGLLLKAAVPEAGARLRVVRLRAAGQASARLLLREFLGAHGLRPPSAGRLAEMLRQIVAAAPGARSAIEHEGAVLRVYRGELLLTRAAAEGFTPIRWWGERRVPIPALHGELRFRTTRGAGIDPVRLDGQPVTIRARAGGERLQPDARRPRRTLKNLFQEAGVPPWERDALPLLFCGTALIWVPGLGVDASFRASERAAGLLPEWRRAEASGAHTAG